MQHNANQRVWRGGSRFSDQTCGVVHGWICTPVSARLSWTTCKGRLKVLTRYRLTSRCLSMGTMMSRRTEAQTLTHRPTHQNRYTHRTNIQHHCCSHTWDQNSYTPLRHVPVPQSRPPLSTSSVTSTSVRQVLPSLDTSAAYAMVSPFLVLSSDEVTVCTLDRAKTERR